MKRLEAKPPPTYWFGPCQRGVKQCPQSSDDEEWKALVGRPVRVDRFIPASYLRHQQAERLLSTTLYRNTSQTLFQNLPDRDVRYAYAQTVDTYLYDADESVVSGGPYSIVPNGDLLVEPARQAGRVHLARTFLMDGNGNLVSTTDEGPSRRDQPESGHGRPDHANGPGALQCSLAVSDRQRHDTTG